MAEDNVVGKRLAYLRTQVGLSQAEFAKKINVSPSTIAMWELGEREIKTSNLIKLAEFFDVPTDFLTGRTNEQNSKKFDPELDADISDLSPEEIDFLNQLKQEVAFKDFLKGPEEQKKSLVDTVKFLMRGMTK